MIVLKMGVEKEEGGSTVQFSHRTLSTGMKNEWENVTYRSVPLRE